MAEYRGSTMVVEIIHSGGTLTMQDQYRTLKNPFSRDAIDSSAGSSDWREFLAGLQQTTIAYEGLNNGAESPLGTADIQTLRGLTSGTARISPHGTSAGNVKYTLAGFITKADLDWAYDDVSKVTWEWQGSGALTASVW